jgi:preprotein translocase subunit YajC
MSGVFKLFKKFSKISKVSVALGLAMGWASASFADMPSLSPTSTPPMNATNLGGVTQNPQNAISSFFPLILIVLVVLFFFWSQRRRTKQMNQMISALNAGDEISMTNGLMGKVKNVGDQALTIEIADGVNIKVQKNAVLQVLPKGTVDRI